MNRLFCLLLMPLLLTISSIDAQEPDLQDSAQFYYEKGNYIKTKFFAEKQLEKIKHQGKDSTYIMALNYLANSNYSLGQFSTALPLYKELAALNKELRGEKSIEYANALSDLGTVHKTLGDLKSAEQLFLESQSILKNEPGEDNIDYAIGLNQLGSLYQALGNYNKAEACFTKQTRILEKVSGTQNRNYALSLSNSAVLYELMGNYKAAETLALKALDIRKSILGEDHPDFSLSLNNLAVLYEKKGLYAKADSLYRIALEISKKAKGENHPAVATILKNLSDINIKRRDFITAETLLKQALKIHNKLGNNHPDYTIILGALGNLYFYTGEYKNAELYFTQSLKLRGQLFDKWNTRYLIGLNDLANFYDAIDADSIASQLYIEAASIEKKVLLEKLDFMSETELLSYLKSRQMDFTAFPYSFLWKYHSPALLQTAYNGRLFTTGISIQNTSNLIRQMEQSKDTTLTALWIKYKNNKTFLNKMMTTPIAKRIADVDSLNDITNDLEKQLLRQSANYRDIKEKLNVAWKDVSSNLKQGEAALEFVRFSRMKKIKTNNTPDTISYAALLLRPKDSVPVFVKLFDEKQLKTALKSFAYKATAQYRGNNNAPVYGNINNSIYNLVWKPLEPYLNNTQTVYFSPEGLLHELAFAAIPYKKNMLLCDRYNLVQLTSTRQIAFPNNLLPAQVSIAMFGGINYTHQQTDTSQQASPDPYAYAYHESRSADLDSFSFLPNTIKEINAIKANSQASQKNFISFTGEKATEAAFRSLGGNNSPAVIHFATHGFTLPDVSKQAGNTGAPFKTSDNPLLRCGLVMAGGNKGWQGKAGSDEDDGILTGLEISSVQLPNTQLAVLSACETGLGKIEGSEGVFGLQRAFKLAGVNYVMASLWQVPDKETAEFMQNFYAQWLGGKTIRQAFLNTQQTMRKKYAPYYWAGFTLVQ